MKKFIYSAMILGSAFALASCSADEPAANGGDGTVTISVSLPEMATRALGDDTDCNQLVYSVYNSEGTPIYNNVEMDAFGPGVTTATLTLQLVPGEEYSFAFYAHNTESHFSSFNDGVISVNYDAENIHPNQEIDDAFYCYITKTIGTNDSLSAVLNRAFAQLNFGTSDIEEPAVVAALSKLTYSLNITDNIFTTLDMKAENPEPTGAATLTLTGSVPAQNDYMTVENISGVTSIYVLTTRADESLLKGSYQTFNGTTPLRDEINLDNVPVKMNYRTNVYGQLLSSNLPVTVRINPIFEGTMNNLIPGTPPETATPMVDADGNVIDGLYKDVENRAYYVGTPEALEYMNANWYKSFPYLNDNGYVLRLYDNIDYTGHIWEPIKDNIDAGGYFYGLDGQGYTIRNLTIQRPDKDNLRFVGTAMFQGAGNAYLKTKNNFIRNLNLENVTVNGNEGEKGSSGCAVLLVGCWDNWDISNVHINNATITGEYNLGTFVGYEWSEGGKVTLTMNNVTASNVTIISTATTPKESATGEKYVTNSIGCVIGWVNGFEGDKLNCTGVSVNGLNITAPDFFEVATDGYFNTTDNLIKWSLETTGITTENVTITRN